MFQVAGRRFVCLFAVLIVVVATLQADAGQTQHPPRLHAKGRFAQAADITFREGVHAKLPPHISTLLGLSREEECPVMQGVLRTGSLVQGFDVSVKNQNDIVLFVVDETASDQTLYLTSPAGALRKVVSVKAGEGNVVRVTYDVEKAFEKERLFWLDRLVPPGAAK
jgi:hypothetical protein